MSINVSFIEENFETAILGGYNIVANPTFENNTDRWTASGTIVSLTEGGINLVNDGCFYQKLSGFDVTTDTEYIARVYIGAVTGTPTMTIGATAGDDSLGSVSLVSGWNRFVFTAGATNYISFNISSATLTIYQIEVRRLIDIDISGDIYYNGEKLDLTPYSTISYNTSIADVSYSGKDITRTAGENVAFGNVAYLKSDGKLWKTDADAEATSKGMLALAVATIAGDASGKFLTQGIARNDAWNWTVGGTLYLSTDAGDLTQTAPSGDEDIVRIVGHAITADIIYFNPSNEYMELEVA